MAALRVETKARARALQLLYAWEVRGQPVFEDVMARLTRASKKAPQTARAERLASDVAAQCGSLDPEIEAVIEGWRYERVGIIEKNILRLALSELIRGETPPRVVIDEAVKLAQWFAGPKAPAFVNGVLDTLARRHHRL